MTAPAPRYDMPHHCPSCGVEWSTDRNAPSRCWLCGGRPEQYADKSVPWTASATYNAALAEKESA